MHVFSSVCIPLEFCSFSISSSNARMTQVYSRYTGGSSYELFDHELIFFLLLLLMGNLPHDFIINEPCRIVSWLTKLRNIKSSRRTFANLFPCSFLSSCTNHEDHESLIRSYFFLSLWFFFHLRRIIIARRTWPAKDKG